MDIPNVLLLERIIENVDIGIIVLDKDANILLWNKWIEKRSKVKIADAKNRRLLEIFPSLKNGRILQGIENALNFNQHSFITHALKQPLFPLYNIEFDDSKQIPIQQKINIYPVKLENYDYVLIEIKDETKFVEKEKILRKRTDDLKVANATKDKFFSIISHDLRSHMSNLLSSMEMLHQQKYKLSEDKIHFFAESMYKITKNLFQLIENLLEWSSSQSGRMQYNPTYIDLDDLIQRYIGLFEEMALKKKINIVYQKETNEKIHGDENMVGSIIRNILSNAIKFTRIEGTIIICLYSNENSVILSIEDNGMGMNQETLNNLFTIGNTKKSIGTAKEKGTGLGLILCKEFIDFHKGSIEVKSKIKVGTKFIVSFPMRQNSFT